jgi:hypothetical protein
VFLLLPASFNGFPHHRWEQPALQQVTTQSAVSSAGIQQQARTAPLFAANPGSIPAVTPAALLAAQTAAGMAGNAAAAAGVGQAAVNAAMAAAAAAVQPGGWGAAGQQQQQQDEMPSELRIAAAHAEKKKRMEVRACRL